MFDREAEGRIKALAKDLHAARAARRKHEQVRQKAEEALWKARARAVRTPGAAFEAFEAGRPAPVTPQGASVDDLQAVIEGADEALRSDREAEDKARGELQATVVVALQTQANAWAAAYLEHANALRGAWEALAGAQTVLGAVVKERAADIMDSTQWSKFYVPSSEQLPALRGRGTDRGDGFHTRVLAACEGREYDAIAASAAAGIEQAIRMLLDGEWPFGAVTGYDPGPVNVQRPEPKNTRRAVLEKAWNETRGDVQP